MFYKTLRISYYSVEPTFNFVYDSIPPRCMRNVTLVGNNPRGDGIAIEGAEWHLLPGKRAFCGARVDVASWALRT